MTGGKDFERGGVEYREKGQGGLESDLVLGSRNMMEMGVFAQHLPSTCLIKLASMGLKPEMEDNDRFV